MPETLTDEYKCSRYPVVSAFTLHKGVMEKWWLEQIFPVSSALTKNFYGTSEKQPNLAWMQWGTECRLLGGSDLESLSADLLSPGCVGCGSPSLSASQGAIPFQTLFSPPHSCFHGKQLPPGQSLYLKKLHSSSPRATPWPTETRMQFYLSLCQGKVHAKEPQGGRSGVRVRVEWGCLNLKHSLRWSSCAVFCF